MKYKSVSYLVVLFITLTFIFGCKKDNPQSPTDPKVEYPGSYSFTTTLTQSTVPDTTILYDGSVSYDDWSKQWTVRFFPYQEIYPTVDDKGVMTYPDFVNNNPNHFFSGNIDDDGNVNFIYGYSIDHHGETYITSFIVTGKKK